MRSSLARGRDRLVALIETVVHEPRSAGRSLLVAPLVFLLVGFFAVPMVYMLRISLHEQTTGGALEPGLTLDNYVEILTSGFIWEVTRFTFGLAAVTTVVTLALSVPYAYAIWRTDSPVVRSTLLFATILSLLVTLVAKLYAWLVLLAPQGVVNRVLLSVGVVDEPLQLVNNELGVVIGIVYTAFPYAVLAIYAVLTSLDEDVLDAAYDLGATRPRAFREVVLPAALPGIVVGGAITFVWAIGSYASPALLGSSNEHTYALEVEALVISEFNWPLGAALSMVVLAVVMLALLALPALPGGGGEHE